MRDDIEYKVTTVAAQTGNPKSQHLNCHCCAAYLILRFIKISIFDLVRYEAHLKAGEFNNKF